jgi:hypothetical protein
MKPASTSLSSNISEQDGARELLKIADVIDAGDDNSTGPVDASQLPVNPRLCSQGDIGATMGLAPASSEGIRQARNALLLSIQMARATGHEGVHYARNRNHYSDFKHNLPNYWTYLNVRRAVDTLLGRPDIVSEIRVRTQNPGVSSFVRKRSALFAGPKFIDAVATAEFHDEPSCPEQRILRRNRRNELLSIPSLPIVDETNSFLSIFDAAIANAQFSFANPDVRWLNPNLATVSHKGWQYLINTSRRKLSRIFSGKMDAGGRFYRGFWQELPKALRATLLIDGGTVAEYDYSACHLRLAHYAMGLAVDLEDGDKYSLDGFGPEWRPQIKRAVQILLNAKTIHSAVAAIARDLPGETWAMKVEFARALAVGIKRKHAAIAPLWHTGCGLGLQYVDSELTRLCAMELLARRILPLPIHDSMLVRAEHLGDLVEVMDRRFAGDGQRLAMERFKDQRGFHGKDLTQGRGTALPGRAAPLASSGDISKSCIPCSPLEPSDQTLGSQPSLRVAVDADIAPLMSHPVLMDLRSIVMHRRWIPAGLVKCALLTAVPLYPDRSSAALAVRAWIARTAVDTRATVDEARLEAEVLLFLKRAPTPQTPQSIARLCGVTSGMAKRLGLSLVVPTPRKPATTRRAKRMEGTLPRIIDVKKAAPWGSTARTTWYAKHPAPADRQVAAFRAILMEGDVASKLTANEAIKRARHERALLSARFELPVDLLLTRLGTLQLLHDFMLHRVANDAYDECFELGDGRLILEYKPCPPAACFDAQMQLLLASSHSPAPI